jgi:hypothetical protein
MGRRRIIRARGVSHTSSSGSRRTPAGAELAFLEVGRGALRTGQEERPVGMIIREDNPEWLLFLAHNTPDRRFTSMWTSLCPYFFPGTKRGPEATT